MQGVRVRVDGRTAELSVSPTVKGTETAMVRDPKNCRLRLLSDRNLLCLYEENSHIIMPMQVQQTPSEELLLRGDGARVKAMEVRELEGSWPETMDAVRV